MPKLTLIGAGVLGSQIAYQAAYKGFDVSIWMHSPSSIERTKPKISELHAIYVQTLTKLIPLAGTDAPCPPGLIEDLKSLDAAHIKSLIERADTAAGALRYDLDLATALKDADLIIEAMPENPQLKAAFYKEAAPLIPENAILATNSSTLVPSDFAALTGCASRYLAMHFANEIWIHNTCEIMGSAETSPEAMEKATAYAKAMGMYPLVLQKEQPGYLLNTMLVPFLQAAEHLWVNDIADIATIDEAWTLGTGAPAGPFRILDVVGLKTAYEINSLDPRVKEEGSDAYKVAERLKKMIDEGRLGLSAGEGFYKYK